MEIYQHIISGNTFHLSANRSLYWENEDAIIVSDLHFGKTGHFRKHGIAIPQNIYKEDIVRLLSIISYYKAKRVIVVGDMFHSNENKELDLFKKWRNDVSHVQIDLVKGNHDILKNEWYTNAAINVHRELSIGSFSFIHDISSINMNDESKSYYFSGHVHPGVVIKAGGKQQLRLPCFYFNHKFAILPAFSRFSGLAAVEVMSKDTIYAILDASNSCKKIQ